MNLVNNAIKFTRKEGIVEIIAEVYGNQNLIYFSVRDTGVGMSSEILKGLG